MKYLVFLTFILSFNCFAEKIIGKAYIDNKLIYTELHYPKFSDNGLYISLRTDYIDTNNTKFAQIESDFKKDRFLPNSVLEDFRVKSKETINFTPEKLELGYNKEINNKETKALKFKVEKNSIADQGFHNFIVANFEELLIKDKKVPIAVASKNDFFYFVITMKDASSEKVNFIVKPNNFLLKQLVSPIELTYAIKDKKLLRFKGLSNLNDVKGDSQFVDIIYEYPN